MAVMVVDVLKLKEAWCDEKRRKALLRCEDAV